MSVSLQVVTTRYGALHVRRSGAGRPVLCLHATGHDARDFDPFAARIGDAYEVIALDWPGQGASAPDGAPPRADHYAELAIAVAEAMGIYHPILLGNSIGGAAALLAATRRPAMFSGLVLCNAGGLAPVDRTARIAIAAMVGLFDAGARGAAWYPAAFRAYYSALVLPGPSARARRRAIIGEARALAPLLAEAWRGFALPEADLRDVARTLGLPVWCAWARSDRIVSWSRARSAIAQIPDVQWTLFRGGHAAFLEDPDRFAAAFRSFAGGVDAARTSARSSHDAPRLERSATT